MNREEQIAYAAKDYCKRNRPSLDSKVLPYIEFGFNQGAIWADKHQRWISVNEKLPAEDEYVLVCFEEYYISIARLLTGAAGEKYWNMDSCGWRFLDHAIYWMPIPEVPQKGG